MSRLRRTYPNYSPVEIQYFAAAPDQIAEQITKADRDACHALCVKGKARATLRRLSSTVLRSIIRDANS
jgi:hypothetical protein